MRSSMSARAVSLICLAEVASNAASNGIETFATGVRNKAGPWFQIPSLSVGSGVCAAWTKEMAGWVTERGFASV
jgi:hypothetical protein